MSVYGYVRVSTELQDFSSQKSIIDDYVSDKSMTLDNVFTFTVSSRKSKSKRGIDEVTSKLKKGDTLLVSEISRLSRSMIETLPVIQQITSKGIELHIIKQNLRITDLENDLVSKIVCNVLGIASEMERTMISERVKAGMKAAKARGVKLGNPRIHEINKTKKNDQSEFITKVKPIIEPMIKAGMTQRKIVDSLNQADIKTSKGGIWHLITLQRVLKNI